MTALAYLIPIALALGLLGLGAFMWALRSGQFDDLEGAGQRILFDDEDEPESRANGAGG
jgi:cbb3-type cytochrome oxidase maturation protein